MNDQRFTKQYRLRGQAEFDRAARGNVYSADGTLVVLGWENGLGYSRLGISVSRRVGGAVVRNRWKRVVREAFRIARPRIPSGIDFVVRPRRDAKLDYHAVVQSLPRLTRRVAERLRRSQG